MSNLIKFLLLSIFLSGCSNTVRQVVIVDKSRPAGSPNQTASKNIDATTFTLSKKPKSTKVTNTNNSLSNTNNSPNNPTSNTSTKLSNTNNLTNTNSPNNPTSNTSTKSTNTSPNKSWSMPINAKIAKDFTKNNRGITFLSRPNQAIMAARDGVVVYVGNRVKADGLTAIIRHPLGFFTTYTQLGQVKVAENDVVDQGRIIASTTDTAFYFEMKKFSTLINPLKYLK